MIEQQKILSVWERWISDIKAIPNEINIETVEETNFGKIYNFYFKSINNTWVFAKLYYSNQAIKEKKPLISLFHGNNSSSNDTWNIWHCMNWVNNNFCVLMIDARNQGGKTIDNSKYQLSEFGYSCNGCLDLETFYEKYLYLDCLKSLLITRDSQIEIFKDLYDKKVIVAGPSQGGQLALAMACLSDIPFLCVPDVPSGCEIRQRIINQEGKYSVLHEVIEKYPQYKDIIFNNVEYFDLCNLSDLIKCPVFSSVGGKDNICPAKYYLVAFDKITTPKQNTVYPEFGHGGFEELHFPKKLEFVINNLGD